MSCEQWLILAEIDECAENSSGCSHGCTNTNGSYICTCPVGYKLMRNQHTCMGELHVSHVVWILHVLNLLISCRHAYIIMHFDTLNVLKYRSMSVSSNVIYD